MYNVRNNEITRSLYLKGRLLTYLRRRNMDGKKTKKTERVMYYLLILKSYLSKGVGGEEK